MCRAGAVVAILLLFCLSTASQADVFNLGSALTNLQTVLVDDAGNVGEMSGGSAGGVGLDRYCGSVGYEFRMGKYEVTAAQYTDFLNHKAATDLYGLYNVEMWANGEGCKIERLGDDGSYTYRVASDWANRPVNFVSFWDACRFTNWLHNGQENGSTENGAYPLNGYNSTSGSDIARNPGARWFVPSEDEWYKSAYYRGGGPSTEYYDFATQNDVIPDNQVVSPDPGNNASCTVGGVYSIGAPYYRTNVGQFANSESGYGTYDQSGNINEWTETVYNSPSAPRAIRGGGYYMSATTLRASRRGSTNPAQEGGYFGFRVAAVVPEPSSFVALGGGLVPLLALSRRRLRARLG